jgi:phage regulator Rha-like protein
MSDLVIVHHDHLVTTTDAISEGTGVQHKNVIELVRTYLADLQEFGGVAFETRPFMTDGGMQNREVALLGEEQSTLLLTYMRNTAVVRQFKKTLVRKFFEMRDRLRAGVPTAPQLDSAVQALKLAPLAMRAARAFGLDKNVAAISANQYVCSVTGHNLLKEFGATHLPAERQDTQWFTPTELSADANVSARKLNEALATAGLQERRGKVWELTPAGHAYARLFDTGKKHNSGVLVQQIKWSPAVLTELRHTGSLL